MTIRARIRSGKRAPGRFLLLFLRRAPALGNLTARDAAAPGPPHFLGAVSCRRVRDLFLLPAAFPRCDPPLAMALASPLPIIRKRQVPASACNSSTGHTGSQSDGSHERTTRSRGQALLRQVVVLAFLPAELNAAGLQIVDECMYGCVNGREPRRNAHWSS